MGTERSFSHLQDFIEAWLKAVPARRGQQGAAGEGGHRLKLARRGAGHGRQERRRQAHPQYGIAGRWSHCGTTIPHRTRRLKRATGLLKLSVEPLRVAELLAPAVIGHPAAISVNGNPAPQYPNPHYCDYRDYRREDQGSARRPDYRPDYQPDYRGKPQSSPFSWSFCPW